MFGALVEGFEKGSYLFRGVAKTKGDILGHGLFCEIHVINDRPEGWNTIAI